MIANKPIHHGHGKSFQGSETKISVDVFSSDGTQRAQKLPESSVVSSTRYSSFSIVPSIAVLEWINRRIDQLRFVFFWPYCETFPFPPSFEFPSP